MLLIDEIDKADIEFPNDLLHELDTMRFTIPETGDEIVAVQRPVVVITSNNEKELPDAFLRHSVLHFIDFLDVEQMHDIIAAPLRRSNNPCSNRSLRRSIGSAITRSVRKGLPAVALA